MTATSESIVEVRHLTKVFRDFWLREKVTAVADLDMDVCSGEVFGLLGPYGSGKSTTLKMILGLLFPTRGWVSILGKRPTDVAVKARIGFLPEESYLYPFLDAHETLDFFGRLFHLPRPQRRRRIDMLLDMVDLRGQAYRRVGEYSKGMQRRIGLAQALINDPDLLILDEPTSGMDPIGSRKFKDLICTLAKRGKTVRLSHLLADVEDICDRVCILYGGRKRALGGIDELLAQSGRVQITLERMGPELLGEIQQVLRQRGAEVLDVTAPRDRLEALFLRIVREAEEQKVPTGGARSSGQMAPFLRGEDGQAKQVIERLVAAASAVEAPLGPVEAVEAAAPDENVWKELMARPPETKETQGGGQPGKAVPQSGQEADRSVIDDLVRKNQEDV